MSEQVIKNINHGNITFVTISKYVTEAINLVSVIKEFQDTDTTLLIASIIKNITSKHPIPDIDPVVVDAIIDKLAPNIFDFIKMSADYLEILGSNIIDEIQESTKEKRCVTCIGCSFRIKKKPPPIAVP